MIRPFGLLNLTFALCIALFLFVPTLDLWVSAVFFHPGSGFWLRQIPLLEALRNVFRYSGDAAAVLGAILLLAARVIGPACRTSPGISGYWLATMALGPGILVNLILKPLWGRARPADITTFGGHDAFTTVYELSNQCVMNCSFVSGEAASATALAIILGTLFWPRTKPGWRPVLAATLASGAILGSGLRVMTGRHFLSDIVFGAFVSAYVAWALYRLMGVAASMPSFTFRGVAFDLAAFARRLLGRMG